jgi:transposase-like protein
MSDTNELKRTGAKRGPKPKYSAEMCGKLVAARADGKSVTAACLELGISRETYYAWRDKHKAFAEAAKEAAAASLVWWEEAMREMARGKDGNVTSAIFMMKNMFPEDYRDRKEITANVSVKSALEDWGKTIEAVESGSSTPD